MLRIGGVGDKGLLIIGGCWIKPADYDEEGDKEERYNELKNVA